MKRFNEFIEALVRATGGSLREKPLDDNGRLYSVISIDRPIEPEKISTLSKILERFSDIISSDSVEFELVDDETSDERTIKNICVLIPDNICE